MEHIIILLDNNIINMFIINNKIKQIEIMVGKIIFEIGFNNNCEFITYEKMTYDKAYSKLKKDYKNHIFYSSKVEY